MRLSDFVFTKMYFCRQNVVLIWPLWIWTSLIKVLEKEIRITYCFRTQRLLLTNLIKMLNNLMFLGLICFVSSNPAQFEEFKRNFDRQYSTESEELQRYEIFRTNLAKINDHNSRKGIMIFIWNWKVIPVLWILMSYVIQERLGGWLWTSLLTSQRKNSGDLTHNKPIFLTKQSSICIV